MASAPGNNGMTTQPGANPMAGNAAYLGSQAAVAAALKQQQQQQHQQQILEQQKQQQQYMQRQLIVEQVTPVTITGFHISQFVLL